MIRSWGNCCLSVLTKTCCVGTQLVSDSLPGKAGESRTSVSGLSFGLSFIQRDDFIAISQALLIVRDENDHFAVLCEFPEMTKQPAFGLLVQFVERLVEDDQV